MPEEDSLPFQCLRPAPSAAIPIGGGTRRVGSARRRKSSFAMRMDSPVSGTCWVVSGACGPQGSGTTHPPSLIKCPSLPPSSPFFTSPPPSFTLGPPSLPLPLSTWWCVEVLWNDRGISREFLFLQHRATKLWTKLVGTLPIGVPSSQCVCVEGGGGRLGVELCRLVGFGACAMLLQPQLHATVCTVHTWFSFSGNKSFVNNQFDVLTTIVYTVPSCQHLGSGSLCGVCLVCCQKACVLFWV